MCYLRAAARPWAEGVAKTGGGGGVVSPSVLRSGGEGCACFLLLFMKGESSSVASIKAEEGDVMLAQ